MTWEGKSRSIVTRISSDDLTVYTPVQFREQRFDILADAIRTIQLATLITATADGYHASHVPTVLKADDDAITLEAHVARSNEHWTALQAGARASLAVFQGPQAYVSPSWYETKRQHGKVVPTWNYIAVHAHGALETVDSEAWLHDHLHDLTSSNERHSEHPWTVTDAPASFIGSLIGAIIGLRLRVDRLEGSWKMIQHRSAGDRSGVMTGLSASSRPGDATVAEVMRALEAARKPSMGE